MDNSLKKGLEYSIQLAEEGQPELAETVLIISAQEFIEQRDVEDPEEVLGLLTKASHRIGADIAFQYAESFYRQGDKSAARGWLRYAKMHAKGIGLNIGDRVYEIKGKYKDRMPLLF